MIQSSKDKEEEKTKDYSDLNFIIRYLSTHKAKKIEKMKGERERVQ